ncbi:PEPxxWA-CTERM sorting domain-containing protein [Microvirga sp. SRT01]|jgi:hypothetical protein|uniref:PEPxxWA-CTERM sorting domain-containing protein n=1 Tax=Sphingomonas longa TaxID=2778730 RepID=A0ABS2DB57_9SPHN|nr:MULTISPECIES: PEPxxWA-CTERM sorting domain-containing protein [Alphaproteobacteria]MBM6577728.1 PEPxxWA-CTERM sorting domain-containing protein [Sphingomonas sp. BT552]MBR7710770.1 PEPxxWA-CTERM sorting domain-containing protein [Microvirga sp. SRT01]
MTLSAKSIMLAAASTMFVMAASTAAATPIITNIGADLSTSPYTFTYMGSSFTFGSNGQLFTGPITVSTANGGEINTTFGEPSAYFPDRGTVSFGPGMNFAAFPTETAIRFSNGENYFGLRAVTNTGTFYGFAYSSDNILNTIGFETVADATITATTMAGAVPEPATWAMMIGGIGMVGGAMRRRRVSTKVSFA